MAQDRLCDILFRDQAEFLFVENLLCNSEAAPPKNHFHNHLEIYYLVSGERYYYMRDRTYYIRPGDLVVVSSNIVHRTYTAKDPRHERIIFEVYTPMLRSIRELFEETGPEEALSGIYGVLRLDPEEQPEVKKLVYGLMREMRERRYGYQAMVKCLLAELLTFIIRRLGSGASAERTITTPKDVKMQEIADYLAAYSSQKLALDEIAERFFISKYHLCRTFKEATGFTLAEYINTSRVMRARELLLTTNSSITDIAGEVGFDSSTHFGKVFKQYMGSSPLAYRKNYRYETPK